MSRSGYNMNLVGMRAAGPPPLSDRLQRLGRVLERVRARCDVAARLELDPVAAVHRYRRPVEQELVGLAASAVAFGNVKALRAKLEQALARLGPDVAAALDDEGDTLRRLEGWKHRVYRGDDLARLLLGARRVQRECGSLGARFSAELGRQADLRCGLASFVGAIRVAGGLAPPGPEQRLGAAHILPDPLGSSGCKRLLLYLRWMIRGADGVDLAFGTCLPRCCSCRWTRTSTGWH